jgi:hypothetical protein
MRFFTDRLYLKDMVGWVFIMADEKKTSGWKIFFYLTPLYIILGYPLYNWHKKINSGDINLSKDDYSAFSSNKGEIKKTSFSASHTPDLNDSGYSGSYKSGGERPDEKKSQRTYQRQEEKLRKTNKPKKQNPNQKQKSNSGAGERIRDRETQYVGQKKGYLTSVVGKAMKSPKVVKALFNNPLVVKGFMSRDTVKKALKDPDALANYITNTNAASNFLNNSVVKAALNNPTVVSALVSSKMAGTLLSSPAVKGLLKDSDKMNEILSSNPELINLLTNPSIMSGLSQNPDAAGVLANLNLQ